MIVRAISVEGPPGRHALKVLSVAGHSRIIPTIHIDTAED